MTCINGTVDMPTNAKSTLAATVRKAIRLISVLNGLPKKRRNRAVLLLGGDDNLSMQTPKALAIRS